MIFTPVENGMTELWASLSADSAAIIKTTLDAMAHTTIHRAGGDERSADQRRADALVDLARTALTDPTPADPARRPQARPGRACTDPAGAGPTGTGRADTEVDACAAGPRSWAATGGAGDDRGVDADGPG